MTEIERQRLREALAKVPNVIVVTPPREVLPDEVHVCNSSHSAALALVLSSVPQLLFALEIAEQQRDAWMRKAQQQDQDPHDEQR